MLSEFHRLERVACRTGFDSGAANDVYTTGTGDRLYLYKKLSFARARSTTFLVALLCVTSLSSRRPLSLPLLPPRIGKGNKRVPDS